MKVHIEMEMTPQEARAFLGLPDVVPLQKTVMDDMQARMMAAFDAGDPEAMMRAWTPFFGGVGGAEAFQKFQMMLRESANAALGRKPGK